VAARVEEKGEGKAAASQGEVRRRGRDIAGRGEEGRARRILVWISLGLGCHDRLLGRPLGLPDLHFTVPVGVKHKDYRGGSTRLGSCTCPVLYRELLDVLD
jgi:hypothetical protein